MTNLTPKAEQTIQHEGDTWRVVGRGVTREDGAVFCHLISTTRGRQQRNGWCPVQVLDWVPDDKLDEGHPDA